MKKLLAFIALALVASAFAIAPIALAGCSDPPPKFPEPTQSQKEVFASVTFKGQLLECVDKFDTKAEQDACATEVIARWGKDGGK